MRSRAIYGLAGPVLSAAEAAFFRAVRPWGFILFARNVEAPDQVAALTAALRETVEDARAPEPDDFMRAGTAISAPMTRNTAAMMTLGNCIAVLLIRPSGGRPGGLGGSGLSGRPGDPGSFLT